MVGEQRRLRGADLRLEQRLRQHRPQGRAEQRVASGPPLRGGFSRARRRAERGGNRKALVLPRVAGQVDDPALAQHGCPGRLRAPAPQRAQGREQRRPLGPLAPERGQQQRLRAVGRALGDGGAQHGVGTDLDEGVDPRAQRFRDGAGEAHGNADVAPEVRRVDLRAADGLARGRREHGDRAGSRPQGGEPRRQLRHDRVELRAVKGVVHRKPSDAYAAGLGLAQDGLDGLRVAGDDRRARTVQRPHADPGAAGEQALRRQLVEFQRGHASEARAALHQAASEHDHARRVLEREDAGHVRGGHLADAVAHDGGGGDPPAAPQCRERDVQGEQGRLGVLRLAEARLRLGSRDLLDHAPAGLRADRLVAEFERLPKHGLLGQQLASHARPLRPLPTEHEGRPWRRAADPRSARARGRHLTAREGLEREAQRIRRIPDRGEAQVVVRPVRRGGPARRAPVAGAAGGEAGRMGVRELAQRVGMARAQRQDRRAHASGGLVGQARRLLEHHVGVRAAEAERADAGEARVARRAARARARSARRAACRRARCAGFSVLKWSLRRDRLVLEHEDGLDQAGDAGCGLEVPDVRLDASRAARRCDRQPPSTSASASTSIGSPSGVPVPWAST